ncbi:MAG: alpha/beta hydrolase [Solirubrobacteraceae bacterium]
MNVREAFNVREFGDPHGRPMLLAHGFGCEQGMWRHMVPAFAADHRVIVFDHMGLGGSDPRYYDAGDYGSLETYARDVLRICEELALEDIVFVGHSVSAMIGVLAARREPTRFGALVLICPSPRYIDDPETAYRGGFSADDIDGLLSTLSHNYLGWAESMAPVIMGAPEGDPLSDELAATFCRADPEIAKRFANATFLSDNRDDLAHVDVRSLVIQTKHDVIAPEFVGRYVADHLPRAELVEIDAVGHCPNMSAPEQTSAAIKAFL